MKTGDELAFLESKISESAIEKTTLLFENDNFLAESPKVKQFLEKEIWQKAIYFFGKDDIEGFRTLPNVQEFGYGNNIYILAQKGLNRSKQAQFPGFQQLEQKDKSVLIRGLDILYGFVKILYIDICLKQRDTSFLLKKNLNEFSVYLGQLDDELEKLENLENVNAESVQEFEAPIDSGSDSE